MNIRIASLLAAATIGLALAGNAEAAPIDYIFTGTGSGSLNGTAFDGSFTMTLVGDTTAVTSGGGEFFNLATSATFASGLLAATLTGSTNEVIDNTASPGFLGFGQLQTVPSFNIAVEALINSAFETYDLASALALTAGSPNPPTAATFETSVGDLDFDAITSLSFQATLPVPEPGMLALFGMGLAGLGMIRWRRPG